MVNLAVAPYNFVPFGPVAKCYDSPEDIPALDQCSHELCSGEIRFKLRAETPVFVSDGKPDGKKELHFMHNAGGAYYLPGSTIRGMVRENMQILGYGSVIPGEDLADYQIYFRDMTSSRSSVASELADYYKTVLDVQSHQFTSGDKKSTVTVPENVHSGYLELIYTDSGKKQYVIRPTKKEVLRVSRKREDVQVFGKYHCRAVRICYDAVGTRVDSIVPYSDDAAQGMESGYLLYTGKPIPKRDPITGEPIENALYIFSEADGTADAVELSEADVNSYREDWEKRENILNSIKPTEYGEKASLFYKLPETVGESKPVFYLKHDGHVYFGMSRFLRIGYSFPLSHGLHNKQKDWIAAFDDRVDYPRAILGYAEKDRALRSRVSFSDFPVKRTVQEGKAVTMILAEPKVSWFAGYVEKGQNYNVDNFSLRGYKLYWLQEEPLPIPRPTSDNDKIGTTIHPLPKGTEFVGKIRFKNLRPAELGLLLWSIRLEDECYQSVGMGKPYGYGRMSVTDLKLNLLNPDTVYGGELAYSPAEPDFTIEHYIDTFDKEISEQIKAKKSSIRNRREIQDFFYIRQLHKYNKTVRYLQLPEYKNLISILPTIADIRSEEEPIQPKPSSANSSPARPNNRMRSGSSTLDPNDWRSKLGSFDLNS